jgi:hypothetical protein
MQAPNTPLRINTQTPIGSGYRWLDAPKLNPKLTEVILRAEVGAALGEG